MEYVFKITKKVTHMESPSRNTLEEKTICAEINDTFEEKEDDEHIFKLISANGKEAILEYDRHYLVKNEHKGYEFNTDLKLNEPKQITSMWGPKQITFTLTYLGIYGEDFKE
jgi:hypothetical protein